MVLRKKSGLTQDLGKINYFEFSPDWVLTFYSGLGQVLILNSGPSQDPDSGPTQDSGPNLRRSAGYNTMLPSWAYGSAVVLNSEYSTQLYVFFETFGGSSEFGFLCANTDYTAENSVNSPYLQYENYRVADTDYVNYSVVLSCIPAGEVNYISNRPVSRVV